MKKTALLLTIVLFCVCLSACEPGWCSFSDFKSEGITSIELINYDNPEQKRFDFSILPGLFHNKPLPFHHDQCTVIETLDKDKEQEFAEQLKKAQIDMVFRCDSPKGYCLKITYSDGNFVIVGLEDEKDGYIGEYSADGSPIEIIGGVRHYCNDPAVLANKYFQYQVPATPV